MRALISGKYDCIFGANELKSYRKWLLVLVQRTRTMILLYL